MRTQKCYRIRLRRLGVTLIELTVVILVLLGLATIGMYFAGNVRTWSLGKQASEKLRTVYAAQRAYLADNPTAAASSLDAAKVIPYLPTGEAALPTLETADGSSYAIKVDVVPPYGVDGGGARYDPSGSTTDGIWDVGE